LVFGYPYKIITLTVADKKQPCVLSYGSMIKTQLTRHLKKSLEKVGVRDENPYLEHPANETHGDYSTSVPLKYASRLHKSPMKIAEDIKENFPKNFLVEAIEIVKPGFVNFWISKPALLEELVRIAENKDTYGKPQVSNKKIMLEFGQPNTHKTPHIGHLFSYIFGESLARILEWEGNQIFRANYQGDIGLHVAKCLYSVKKKIEEGRRLDDLKKKVDFLQTCYQEGSYQYEHNETAQKEIDALNMDIYSHKGIAGEIWDETRSWSVEFYRLFEKKLGIRYDRHYYESQTSAPGKGIVEKHVGTVFVKSEGAIIFKGEPYGLHTRVFINKYGNPTYEAKDVGLISMKKKDYPLDLSLVTTANEQNEYWKVIIKASELVFPELKGKLKHLGFGMIQLTTGKMASRTGKIIDAFSLVDTVTDEIIRLYKGDRESAEKISLAAIKYSFLRSEPLKNIVFDLKMSIAKDGDSGPYLLYTYVRTKSILSKNPTLPSLQTVSIDISGEMGILRKLYRFPEVVENAAKSYSPHLLAGYLYDLAREFNLFYQKCPVLKATGEKRTVRIFLTNAVSLILKSGLNLLGIETVDKM